MSLSRDGTGHRLRTARAHHVGRLLGKPARDVAVSGVHELVFGDFRIFYEVTSTIDVLTVRRASELIDEDELSAAD